MKRFLAITLMLVLLLGILPVSAAGDATDMEEMKTLINSVTLYPQRTGYAKMDALLEEIFAPYADSDNFTKLKAAYDWTVTEINYSWGPYSQNWAPAYDCFVPVYELEYEEGLQEAMPFEIVNRSYHAIAAHEGICYDYGAAFAVMARYLGFESYVHTGEFIFEDSFGGGSGHHGWAELDLNGTRYIFDPQRDYRMSANATEEIPYLYFGISYEKAWRYDQETSANEARNAGFLSVTAERKVSIDVYATASGKASGAGDYAIGETANLTAEGDFLGWYGADGQLLSKETNYSFTITAPLKLRAVFANEYFDDVKDQWYAADANAAFENGMVAGMAPFYFDAQTGMSRAMVLTMLYRMVGSPEATETASYEDVAADAWYAAAVNWGTQEGIVYGMGKNQFDPDRLITREQFICMMMRLAKREEAAELEYSDADTVSAYAVEAMQQAQAAGLLAGYEDGTIKPQNQMTRAEGVSLLMRLSRYLEQ